MADHPSEYPGQLFELPEDPDWNALPVPHQRFLQEYATRNFRNATEAYRAAGYGGETENRAALHAAASRLLASDGIQKVLKRIARLFLMSVEEAGMRLSELARADVADLHTVAVREYDEAGAKLAKPEVSVHFDLARAIAEGRSYVVAGLRPTQWGLGIDVENRTTALVKVLELHGKLGARAQAAGTVDDPLNVVGMTMDEWKAEAAKRRERIAAAIPGYDPGSGLPPPSTAAPDAPEAPAGPEDGEA